MLKKIIALVFLVCSSLAQPTSYWDWSRINIHNISFPASFTWGTTLIAREVEGNPAKDTFSTYAGYIKDNGQIFEATPVGKASDYWNKYKEDIDRMVKHGLTSLCRSLDWAKIEPIEGYFDEAVLTRYIAEFAYAHSRGIKTTIILKEYSDPQWFIDKSGFESKQNIILFERYCLKVFNALQGYVDAYITFWCPDSYAMLGYWTDNHPPFK